MTLRSRSCLLIFVLSFSLILLPAVSAQEASQKETEAMDFAHGLLEKQMWDMALAEYQKFLTEFPQSPLLDEAQFSIGETYFLSQDFPKAVETFQAFRQQYPSSTRLALAVLRLGQVYIQQNNFDLAFQEMSSLDPAALLQGEHLQSYYFYLGKAALGKNDAVAALTNFEKASQVPEAKAYLSNVFEHIAGIQAQGGRFSEASDALSKALAATEDPTYQARLTYKLGEALFRADHYEEAIPYFRKVLDQYSSVDVAFEAVTNLLLAYFNGKKFEDVVSAYQSYAPLIKEEERFFEAHYAAARSFAALLKYDEALGLLDKVVVFSGVSDDELCRANLEKAGVLTKKGQYDQGLSLIESSSPNCPEGAEQRDFLKAQANFGLKNFQKAFELYQEILNTYPDSNFVSAARLGMAHSRLELGEGAEAAGLFLTYADSEDDAALKSEAIFNAALVLAEANADQKAMELIQRYMTEFPQGNDYENVVLLFGEIHAKSGQFEAAAKLLQNHLTTPERVKRADKVNFLLGYNLQLAGKSDEALTAYAAIAADPNDAQFYLAGLKNSAILFLGRQDEAKAVEYFDRMIMASAQNTLDFKTYLWVCNQYLKGGKFQDALRIAEQATAHHPDQQPQAIAYFKAEAYRELKDFENAQKFYEAALAAPEKNIYASAAQIGQGLNLLATNKLDEAQKVLEKAIEDNPEDYTVTLRARFEIANIARLQNKLEEALNFYLMVGAIYDDDVYCPQALMSAGEILEGFARKEEALKAYQDVALKYPASAQAAQAQQKVSSLK